MQPRAPHARVVLDATVVPLRAAERALSRFFEIVRGFGRVSEKPFRTLLSGF
jgi:hypothetical protein